MKRALFLAVLLLAPDAHAHRRDLSYADVRETDRTLVLAIDIDPHDTPLLERIDRDGDNTVTAEEVAAQREALLAFTIGRVQVKRTGGECKLRGPATDTFYADVQMWHADATFDCPAEAASFTLYLGYVDSLPKSHRAMLKIVSDGRIAVQSVIAPKQAVIPPRSTSLIDSGARFVSLGVHHIYDGLDHLAFVLALILAASSIGRALVVLSAFTVAHSVSLGLAAAGIVALPEKPVEVIIALSIAVVAVEGVIARERVWLRAVLAFAFGLVHGLGFASALAEALFSAQAFLWSIASFNVGVEIGQAALVACVLPALIAARATRLRSWQLALAAAAPLPIAWFAGAMNAVIVGVFVALMLALATLRRPLVIANAVLVLAGLAWAIERAIS